MKRKNKFLTALFVIIFYLLSWQSVFAQSIGQTELGTPIYKLPSGQVGLDSLFIHQLHKFRASKTQMSPLFVPDSFLPDYARENPAGYSYLCRLEKQIEKKTPVALWVRAGKEAPYDFKSYQTGTVYVQFKLLNLK